MFSQYKHHITVKCLLWSLPGCGFCFVSPVFWGDASGKEMVLKSGILNPLVWDKGDGLMADGGFTIQDYVSELGLDLIIPSFLDGREQLTVEETDDTHSANSL